MMSRTLVTEGCHELCLLHVSDHNRSRHVLIELTAGLQILVSSDLTSRCLGLIVTQRRNMPSCCLLQPVPTEAASSSHQSLR